MPAKAGIQISRWLGGSGFRLALCLAGMTILFLRRHRDQVLMLCPAEAPASLPNTAPDTSPVPLG